MRLGPFLTAIDSRAAVKGSIDPLGQLSIWIHFGRKIIGNLTTVANSARDFGVLLMGAWLAEEVETKSRSAQDLQTFLKWESLVAFSRVSQDSRTRLRGIERVKRRLGDSGTQLVSAEKPDQILSNQKMYGLYGLFTVPARKSGLLEDGRFRLKEDARKFVEEVYVRRLNRLLPRGTDGLVDLLSKESFKLTIGGKDEGLAKAISEVFGLKLSKIECGFFREWLLFARHTENAEVQPEAAEVMLETVDDTDFKFTLKSVARLAAEAGRRFQQSDLGQRFLDVVACESVIGPAALLFSFALGREGDSLKKIAADAGKAWKSGLTKTINVESFAQLRLPAIVGARQGKLWNDLAPTLYAGEWEAALEILLRINAAVMQDRGDSASWAEVENQKLKVRRRDESAALAEWREVPNIWIHPYFLSSLRQIAIDVGGQS